MYWRGIQWHMGESMYKMLQGYTANSSVPNLNCLVLVK